MIEDHSQVTPPEPPDFFLDITPESSVQDLRAAEAARDAWMESEEGEEWMRYGAKLVEKMNGV